MHSLINKIARIANAMPEWWVFALSLSAWTYLSVLNQPYAAYTEPVLCFSNPRLEELANNEMLSPSKWNHFLSGWLVMIVAMMFPALKSQVQHVAFSVPKKKRVIAISSFLLSYSLGWFMLGILIFVVKVIFINNTMQINSINTHIFAAVGFVLLAFQVGTLNRASILVNCERTMPIRIGFRLLILDSTEFGFTTAYYCIKRCIIPMLAVSILDHGVVIMLCVAAALIYEQYFLRHKSSVMMYIWSFFAFALVMKGFIVSYNSFNFF